MNTKSPSKEWLIQEDHYRPDRELYWETIFALSNGYMAARGTLDENHACPHIRSCFGTYVAGIFDQYHGHYQAIVNLADFFNTAVHVNGELADMTQGAVEDYARFLDMYNGVLVRRFLWTNAKGQTTQFEITRFISKADPHLAVQHVRVKPLNYSGEIRIANVLDGNVTNIDFHVSGYQLRDEKYFFIADEHEAAGAGNGGHLVLKTRKTGHRVCELFRFALAADGRPLPASGSFETAPRRLAGHVTIEAARGVEYTFLKAVAVYTSNDGVKDLVRAASEKADEALARGYERLLDEHARAWNECWATSDVRIEGDERDLSRSERDQRNVRFNIYHLIQMGNRNNPRVNIGSRGLTSEMHYGNCFWDTEIFILPFFIYSEPAAARALAQYRHLTLPAAREKARSQWLEGAMFPWMSSYPGKEQADYWEYANIAVHIVSDVAFGLMHYYRATGDRDFMLQCGLEILIETARFWASRVDYSEEKQAYVLTLVKGPDEYGIVNNNTYTNWNARWNLVQARKMVHWAREKHRDAFEPLCRKLDFDVAEVDQWSKIIEKMYIHYDPKQDLYIEDDSLFDKKPADLKRLKPGKKITTEMGHPWDLLLRLRIIKQADVLLLMVLHRPDFTRRQLENAWKAYEPITLHDSSLSYNTHSIVANELGLAEKSDEYFQQTARLDLEDVMENVFLGIHSANAGGTWQCVVNGFGGMRLFDDRIEFNPRLPGRWKKLAFHVWFRGNLFSVAVEHDRATIALERGQGAPCRIEGNRILAEPL